MSVANKLLKTKLKEAGWELMREICTDWLVSQSGCFYTPWCPLVDNISGDLLAVLESEEVGGRAGWLEEEERSCGVFWEYVYVST